MGEPPYAPFQRLKAQRGEALSNFAFKFNSRRYTAAYAELVAARASKHGRAVQVDPIRHKVKSPGPKHLKLKYD
jgi:hypothetical protein